MIASPEAEPVGLCALFIVAQIGLPHDSRMRGEYKRYCKNQWKAYKKYGGRY